MGLFGCDCSKPKAAPAPVEAEAPLAVPRLSHQTLDQLQRCLKLEAAFPAPLGPKGESAEDEVRRKIEHSRNTIGDVAQACGFETAELYAAFRLRNDVAKAEAGEDGFLSANKGRTVAELKAAAERGWEEEVDAGRLEPERRDALRSSMDGTWANIEKGRARQARRDTSTSLDVSILTDVVADKGSKLTQTIEGLGKRQPPLSDDERRALASWKAPPP